MNGKDNLVYVALVTPALSMRLGLRALLADDPDIIIDLEASSLEELEKKERPGMVYIVAGRAAAGLGIDAFLRDTRPGIGILLMVEEPLASSIFARLEQTAWGILSLDSTSVELIAAIRAINAGLWVGDPTLMSGQMRPQFMGFPNEDDLLAEDLTPREMEVLQKLALGLANKQIGTALKMSENTVKFHISSIYAKLGASNRAEAVRLGARRGYIIL